MQTDILDALEDLGYDGNLLDENNLEKAIDGGAKNVEYTQLVEWLCKELKALCSLEEQVNSITTEEDSSNFLMEVSSFIKELGCSYASLTEGHLSERLSTKQSRLLLLDYLLTELMAARMVKVDKPHLNKGIELKLEETSTAADLKALLLALKFSKPPENITPSLLFSKVEQKLREVISSAPPELVGKPLFTGKLSDKQWFTLGDVQNELNDEYKVRRDMLIKRLDVTIQSFQWSDKAKSNIDEITSKYNSKRSKMIVEPNVDLADLLAAREDLAIVEKASSASVRKNTQSSINKVIIGRVPDRGGRPSEQEAPPPEMPSWQKERAPGGGGRGGGRGGGSAHGGGRVQGNWNQPNQRQDSGSFQDSRGFQEKGYNDNRGGYQDNRGGYQDNRGGYQDNRGGYQDNRGGYGNRGYQDNRGYHDNRGHNNRDRGGYDNRDRDRGGHRGGRGRRDYY